MQLIEVTGPGIAYMCLGGFIVAFSMFSLFAREKIYLNEVVLGTLFGIIIGPYVAGIFDPREWGKHSDAITLEITRVVLATGLFAIGVELPKNYMAKHAKGLLAMIIPTMAIGWIVVAGLLRVLFPMLDFRTCLAISACLTPTDPIISAAIVGGKFAKTHVPSSLRHLISAESAANDGLAYPFLTLALYLTLESSSQTALIHWVLIGCLYQVVLGIIIGAVLGFLFSHLMKISHRHGFIDRESYIAQYIALSLFIIGVVRTVGSDDLLAAFAAGSAISWDGDFNIHTEGELFASVIDLVLNGACFVYIGAWLPFGSFTIPDLGISPGRLVMLTVGIMALRRIPAIMFLYKWIPEINSWREALFSGHFGPMGVGAVFISTLALHKLPAPANPPTSQQDYLALTIQPIVSFIVLSSIIVHGLSVSFFTFGRSLSRTISSSTTLSPRLPGLSPEWLLGTSRYPTLPREPGASSETVVQQTDSDLVTRTVQAGTIQRESDRVPSLDDPEAPVLDVTGASKSPMGIVEDILEKRRRKLAFLPASSE